MKVVLISPPYTLEDRYGSKLKVAGPSLPPLGLAYLASYLEKKGHDVEIIDAPAMCMSSSDIGKYLKNKHIDIIGVIVYTPMYARFVEMVKKIKDVLGDVPIVAGGPHASIMPKQLLEERKELDYVVFGEGELTMGELMEVIDGSIDPSHVKGLGYRDGGNIIINESRHFIKNIDNLPSPAWHLLPLEKYKPAPSTYKKLPVMHMITSRGCPFNCIYCSSRSIFGRVHRPHSPDRIIHEMNFLVDKYNVKEIFFLDDILDVLRI